MGRSIAHSQENLNGFSPYQDLLVSGTAFCYVGASLKRENMVKGRLVYGVAAR